MNRKALTGGVVAVVALFLIAYFASPVLAVRGLIDAAKRGDEAALERLVDFPAFRQSLKEELNARLVAEMRAELGAHDSALGGLGMMFAPALIGGAVDAFVTAPAIAAMVRTGEAPATEDVARDRPVPADDKAVREDDDGDLRRSYSYRGLNTFAVTLTDPDRPEHRLDLLLERRGAFGWKLADLDLPAPPASDRNGRPARSGEG